MPKKKKTKKKYSLKKAKKRMISKLEYKNENFVLFVAKRQSR